MNVVDSSCWLEFLTDGPQGGLFKSVIQDDKNLIVPTICLYEVFKFILNHAGEKEAIRVAGLMSFGQVVDLNKEIALTASQVSIQHKLAMADSIIYATALLHGASLWTMDEHFKSLKKIKFFGKK